MAVHFATRLARLPLRRLCRILLLPLLLVLSQQGALLHALSHHATVAVSGEQGSDKQHRPGSPCELCLAFAQVGAGAAPVGLLAPIDLSFDWIDDASSAAVASAVPALRNRGPPTEG